MTLSPIFSPVGYGKLPGWADDDAGGAYAAFRKSALYVAAAPKPYRTGSLGVRIEAFDDAF